MNRHCNILPNKKCFRSFLFINVILFFGLSICVCIKLTWLTTREHVGVHTSLIFTTTDIKPQTMFLQNSFNLNFSQNVDLSHTVTTKKPCLLFPLISNNSNDYLKLVHQVGIAVVEDRKRYVCPRFVGHFAGRLGNLMFLYASNYGLAFDLNYTLAMSNSDSLYEPFENLPRSKKERSKVCYSYDQYEHKFSRIYVNFPIANIGHNFRFNGWLQSWKYFSHSFDDILQQFTWTIHIRNTASSIIDNLVKLHYDSPTIHNESYITTVAIHIRRGDYIFHKKPMVDKTYIEQAKLYFTTRYKRVLFIVATNPDKEARDWCMDNVINGSGISVMSGQNDRYVDMAILTLTDHVIISTGTFGWWGAFLNTGTVVFYDWIPPGYYQGKREDYILPWWVAIKSTTKYPPGPPTLRPNSI